MVSKRSRLSAILGLVVLHLGSALVAEGAPNMLLVKRVEWQEKVGSTILGSYEPKQGSQFLVVDVSLPAGEIDTQDVEVLNKSGVRYAAVGFLLSKSNAFMGRYTFKAEVDLIHRFVFDIPDSELTKPLKLRHKGSQPVPLTLPK